MIKKMLYFGNPAYLSVKDEQLFIESKEIINDNQYPYRGHSQHKLTISFDDIGFIVLDNRQITITHCVIEKCMEHNIALISCDSKRMPNGLFFPLSGNLLQSERFNFQIEASVSLKKRLWQQTIIAKVKNQGLALKKNYGRNVQDFLNLSKNVKSGDSSNIESQAAILYWKCAFPHISDFNRGREEDSPNNLLNYGYAILRAIVARGLVCAGLLPTFGIFHRNRYNAYCLADDLMEPYRPFVDLLVMKIVGENLDYSILRADFKKKLLGISILDVKINKLKRPLMNAVAETCNSLVKCFKNEITDITYPTII